MTTIFKLDGQHDARIELDHRSTAAVPSGVERLPANARGKFDDLARQRGAAFGAARAAGEKLNVIRKNLSNARTHLARLSASSVISEAIEGEATNQNIARLEAQLNRAEVDERACAEKAQRIGAIHERVLQWLNRLPPGNSPLHEISRGNPAFRRPADGWQALIDARRAEVERLHADIRRVACAPTPSSVAKQLAREHVRQLVERGAPDVFALIESGADITYPTANMSEYSGPGFGLDRSIDAIAVLAWLNPEAFIARLEGEIDRRSDDAAALLPQQRDQQTAQLAAALLKAEREEESVIEAAERDGMPILRRLNADPRAVLGLSGDLPAPQFY